MNWPRYDSDDKLAVVDFKKRRIAPALGVAILARYLVDHDRARISGALHVDLVLAGGDALDDCDAFARQRINRQKTRCEQRF